MANAINVAIKSNRSSSDLKIIGEAAFLSSTICNITFNDNAILKNTEKTVDAIWCEVEDIGDLAYNHNSVLAVARESLKKLVISSTVLKSLFPNGFTMPELQLTYESILNKKFDRRNFRKKLLGLGLIKETDSVIVFKGNKPAKKYVFEENIIEKEIL